MLKYILDHFLPILALAAVVPLSLEVVSEDAMAGTPVIGLTKSSLYAGQHQYGTDLASRLSATDIRELYVVSNNPPVQLTTTTGRLGTLVVTFILLHSVSCLISSLTYG